MDVLFLQYDDGIDGVIAVCPDEPCTDGADEYDVMCYYIDRGELVFCGVDLQKALLLPPAIDHIVLKNALEKAGITINLGSNLK